MEQSLTKQTSLMAYDSLEPVVLCLQQKIIYDAIIVHGPVTDKDLSVLTGINGDSLRPRRGELVKAGLIVPCGMVVLPSGRKAVQWITKNKLGSENYGLD